MVALYFPSKIRYEANQLRNTLKSEARCTITYFVREQAYSYIFCSESAVTNTVGGTTDREEALVWPKYLQSKIKDWGYLLSLRIRYNSCSRFEDGNRQHWLLGCGANRRIPRVRYSKGLPTQPAYPEGKTVIDSSFFWV